ncbi:MAG: cysteine desulfurase family protein [Actinomycetota bacterium]
MTHYLDNAATTRVRPGALEAMLPLFTETYGNPSGAHRMARLANHALDDARDAVAVATGAEPGQVVFTGGGTEADALAIRGVIDAAGGVPVTTAIEHHAVLDPVTHLGGRVVPVAADGRIDLDALEATLTEVAATGDTVSVVSIMTANNETGVIQPLRETVEVVRRSAPDAAVHTDAVQALCWVDLAEAAATVDLLSISAHKFGGPKGTGALIVRNGVTLAPLLRGGGQERDRRGGTQNVAGIAGMAAAASETVAERSAALGRVTALRDRLIEGIRGAVDGVHESGVGADADRSHKTANIAHLCFEGIESEALLFLLEKNDIMASAASSCASGAQEPSHVLAAMGVPRHLAAGSLRLSLGYDSTEADVDAVLDVLPGAVARLRGQG